VPFVSGTGNYKRKREKRSKEIRQREKDKLEQAKNVYLSIKQLHLQELNQSWTLYFSLSLSLSLSPIQLIVALKISISCSDDLIKIQTSFEISGFLKVSKSSMASGYLKLI